jgi:lysyl-tRNA synthetase class 2
MGEGESNEYMDRLEKVGKMREMGVIPYGSSFVRTHKIAELALADATIGMEQIVWGLQKNIAIAGRLMLHRDHGKLIFAKLLDQSWEIQLMFHKEFTHLLTAQGGPDVETDAFAFLKKFVEVGDFIGVVWDLFYTKKQELTLFVSEVIFLSKTLRKMGEKWHGVTNQETLYRHRYIDTTIQRATHERFLLRSKFLRVIRAFYHTHEFIEVETPILGHYASWAAAKPFITKHNELDMEMYLRISPETALKKMTVGMFEKVFEVAKDFRNEWSDPSHHQEFTMIEHYAAYRNYKDNMAFTEEMFAYIFANIPELKSTVNVVSKSGETKVVDFAKPWAKIDYIEQIKIDAGIDVTQYGPQDEEALRNEIIKKWLHWSGLEEQATATMIDYLYKKVTRPNIVGPAFVYNYPKTMQPLARPSDANPAIVEQWQLVVNGWEIIKAYSELVDPVLQKQNFVDQQQALEKGDEEATSGDDDFLLAMEYGMPPQSWRGMGIDRVLAILTECTNIRDVIYSPIMAPQQE